MQAIDALKRLRDIFDGVSKPSGGFARVRPIDFAEWAAILDKAIAPLESLVLTSSVIVADPCPLEWETDWDDDDNPIYEADSCYVATDTDTAPFRHRVKPALHRGIIVWVIVSDAELLHPDDELAEFPTADAAKAECQSRNDACVRGHQATRTALNGE